MDYGEVVIGENCVRQKLEEEEAEFRMTGTMNQATDTVALYMCHLTEFL